MYNKCIIAWKPQAFTNQSEFDYAWRVLNFGLEHDRQTLKEIVYIYTKAESLWTFEYNHLKTG